MARNIAQRLDRLERLASALLARDTSPVYARGEVEGVDPERLVIIRRTYIDPPERGEEQLLEMPPVQSQPEPEPVKGLQSPRSARKGAEVRFHHAR
jgi:hypothetical protein